MYVIYPLICYNAAKALDTSKRGLETILRTIGFSRPQVIPATMVWTAILAHSLLALARILAQVRAYSAPLHVLEHVQGPSTLCFGKDWYRYPSSFFVPNNSRAAFVKSEFRGLLPGRFNESTELGWRSGIWQVPTGMNDRNIENPNHLVISARYRSHDRYQLSGVTTSWTLTFR
jgi:alpha-1,2-mannosyltransferase